jgi:tripartite-type tricarboxylate transporter receptor subunit TctC
MIGAALALVITFAGSPRAQQAPAAFYQGKQIQFFTMGSAGGGYDAYTRAIAARLEKSLGARVVTVNEPAAGGLVAMNRLLLAKADGLSLLLIGGEALALAALLGEPGVNYDPLGQTWLARVSAENKVVLVGPKSPFKSIKDMIASDRPVIWAGSGKTDGNSDFQSVLAYATGMKARMIIGYKGTGGMNIAMENGEVDGRIVSDESAALYGPSSGMKVIVTLARKRAPQFPAVKTVFESVDLSPEAEKLLDWRTGVAELGRLINVTPGTPPERVEFLRVRLHEILTDRDFIEDMRKTKLSTSYGSAGDVTSMMSNAMKALDATTLARVKDIAINRYY